ncbi:MAG TPA: heavy-metal-associated domain-containing protein [Virgibacillus sp.]|nr:heavy-metal-associated domain-containing protein [Virgibacillus sp.]
MKTIELRLEPLSCPSCIKRIEGALKKTKGTQDVRVLFNSSKVKATYDDSVTDAETIADIVEKLGYPIVSKKAS